MHIKLQGQQKPEKCLYNYKQKIKNAKQVTNEGIISSIEFIEKSLMGEGQVLC